MWSNSEHIFKISEIIQDNSWNLCHKAIDFNIRVRSNVIANMGNDKRKYRQPGPGKKELWVRNLTLEFLLDTQEEMLIRQLDKIE